MAHLGSKSTHNIVLFRADDGSSKEGSQFAPFPPLVSRGG